MEKDLTNIRYIVRHVTEQAIAFMDKRGWPLDDEEKFSTVCGFMLGMLYAHVKQPAEKKTAPRKEGKNDWASELVKTESGYIWANEAAKLIRDEHKRAINILNSLEADSFMKQKPDCTRCYLESIREAKKRLQTGRCAC